MVEMMSGMLGATSLNRNFAMGHATGMPDLSATSRKREERSFFLRNGVGSQKSAQALGAPGTIKNCLITTEVTTTFFIAPCTPISYTAVLRPIAVSRVMRFGQVSQPSHVPHRCPDRGFVFGGANLERNYP